MDYNKGIFMREEFCLDVSLIVMIIHNGKLNVL